MNAVQTVRLGEIADLEVGFAFKSEGFTKDSSGIRLLRGYNIAPGRTRWDRTEAWPESNPIDERYILRDGDIVLAMDRPWIEGGLKYARIRQPDLPSYLVQRVARLRAKDGSDQGYLACVVASKEFTQHVLTVQTGTSIPHISGRQITDYRMPRHTLEEQRAISDVLGALNDKIAANTKLAMTASDLAGLQYDRSTANVDMRPMSEVLTPVLGGTPPRSRSDFWDGNNPWASAKDITGADFGVVTDTCEKITAVAVEGTKAKPLPKGSVILTARGTVGAVARLAVPASFNQSCYGFVPGGVPPGVLYFAIMRATARAKEVAHGSVFDTITMKTFDHLEFPAFDSEAILAVEAKVEPLLDIVTAAVVENGSLGRLRDALLPQLMSGTVRVKDAEKVLENAGI